MNLRGTIVTVATLLLTVSCSGTTTKPAPSQPATLPAAQRADRPFYVSDSAWAASRPLSSLKDVGDTAFSTTEVSETSSEPEVIVRKDPKGAVCLSEMTRLWASPGIDIANRTTGIITTILNVAITKTSTGYTLSTGTDPIKDHVFGPTEKCTNPLKIDTSPSARAMVGDPDSFHDGQFGYMTPELVWTDGKTKVASLLTNATSSFPFAGAVKVTKQDGQLIVSRIAGSGKFHIVGASQMATNKKDQFTMAKIH